MDELRSLQRRLDAVERLLEADRDARADPLAVFVVKTTSVGTYPTAAKAWYAYQVQSISGPESEGAAATLADAAATPKGWMLNLGSNVPPTGTAVVASQERGGRVVFTY